ncbi:MAG TPA: trigger factor [Stellaceae bacterium]|nr:trigger factor [Stellaceae bacterium]
MQVTETSADGLKREFTITVPAGDLEQEIMRRLGEIGRQVRLPGFRPGKVPMQILRQRFGPSVRGEVLQNTLQTSSAEAISERKLRPALPPKVDIVSAGEGADLEYKMAVEVLPEIPEPSFSDLGIERLVVEVPEQEVDRAIERIAEQHRKSEAVERPAEDGDIILVDVEGRVGDQEIPGASGKDRQIVLGAGGSIPGFEDQLVGAAVGEHRTVNVTFPEDYPVADLAGKEAVFTVDVKEIRQRLPIAIDDELGKAIGLESLVELRQELQQRMQRDYDAASRLRLKRSLLDKLAEGYDFAVPPGMVDLEFENLWHQYQAERGAQPSATGADALAAAAGEADTEATLAGTREAGIEATLAGAGEAGSEATLADTSEAGADATPAAAGEAGTEGTLADTREAGAGATPTDAEEAGTEATLADTREAGADATPTDAGGAAEATGAAPTASPDDTGQSEEAVKAEYRKIAERRVRLGLLLAEVGRSNNITVTQDEVNQAITREARRHPGHERQVLDFYRQNPAAIDTLRAPIFEDKVIDFIVELAKIGERKVTPQELLAIPDPPGEDAPPS